MLTRSILRDTIASISFHGVALEPTADSAPSLGRHICRAARGAVHDEQHCKPILADLSVRLGVLVLCDARFDSTAALVARLEQIAQELPS